MICLFSSIKEIFTGQPLIPFQGGACKARKSVIVVPCTCLPDSNNRKYRNQILISHSPFDDFEIPRQEATRKRAIPSDIINKVWKLPYKGTKKGYKSTCRYDLAKDCFILSFCLMGMNSADLYYATDIKNGTITYNRTKTKARRLDSAKMQVDIPPMLKPLIEKYRDKSGKRIFNFYHNYADEKGFNKAINAGLKEIGSILEIEDLEYYAARHSWATIALNKVGIDKYTIHSALNHVDESMRVTDIYIKRDFPLRLSTALYLYNL